VEKPLQTYVKNISTSGQRQNAYRSVNPFAGASSYVASISRESGCLNSSNAVLNRIDEELCALLLGVLGAGHSVALCLCRLKNLMVIATLHAGLQHEVLI